MNTIQIINYLILARRKAAHEEGIEDYMNASRPDEMSGVIQEIIWAIAHGVDPDNKAGAIEILDWALADYDESHETERAAEAKEN